MLLVLLLLCAPTWSWAHNRLEPFRRNAGHFPSVLCVPSVVKNSSVTVACVYDAEGNLVWMNRDNKNYAFVWDALARLSGATVRDGAGNGLNWSAAYDALGRRVQTVTQVVSNNVLAGAAEVCAALCDPLAPLQEVVRQTTAGGNTTNDFFLYGPDLSDRPGGAGGIGGLLATRQNGAVYHTLSDLRGNVVGWINTNGAAAWNPRYGAFGPLATPTLNAPSFSTRWRDPTGLYYFGGRYYDPAGGRFLSPDPARFADSRNLYAYCGNDPMNGFDPDGMLQSGWGHQSYDKNVVDNIRYAPDINYDGRYGYVAKTQGGAAAALLWLGDMTGLTHIYEAMSGNNLATGKWLSSGEQRQSAAIGLASLAMMAAPLVRVEGTLASAEMGVAARTEMGVARAEIGAAAKSGAGLLTSGTRTPNAGGVIRSFAQESDQVYYRVFSENAQGRYLTATPPRSSAWAREALALPDGNQANYIQEVLVPAGTRLQRSRALPAFGRQGGAEQFELLEKIPNGNFGAGSTFP